MQAQGFIGDGSQVTNVDAATLEGNAASDFAGASETAAVIAALQAQVAELLSCRGRRFLGLGDGTVLDCNTGLIWLRNASCSDLAGTDIHGSGTWATAQSAAAALSHGTCGLTDGSSAGDWRLPTIREWCSAWSGSPITCPASAAPTSMIDYLAGFPPTIPTPNPFGGVSALYWSATEGGGALAGGTAAWYVDLSYSLVGSASKTTSWLYVWPVRVGQ